ncbi:hypothetical protein CVT25_006255 [Psilocybe cyanescens]|uniref:Uncharacterized protein n=1 Tax=Psilocybe cyanescens TaxID=93625 RepID=A0A409WYT4_PSICY|nr:hypothetical protein CVT25_006255 [Psilocybe cyanescens]
MSRAGPRVHRLPQRTDFKLIPAPLDLSLPLAEKSSLPAIIVTPSSPTNTRDFSIAFLAADPKPSVRQRLSPSKVFSSPSLRLRSILFVLVVIFVLVCHLVTHSLAARHPRLELVVQTGEVHVVEGSNKWFGLGSMLARQAPVEDAFHESATTGVPGAR